VALASGTISPIGSAVRVFLKSETLLALAGLAGGGGGGGLVSGVKVAEAELEGGGRRVSMGTGLKFVRFGGELLKAGGGGPSKLLLLKSGLKLLLLLLKLLLLKLLWKPRPPRWLSNPPRWP